MKLRLLAQTERRAEENPFPEEFGAGQWPLHHQVMTAQALERGDPLVMNTHDTGAGKTRAALLHLRVLAQRPAEQGRVLLIAPTNELIRQHVEDVERFIQRNGLPFVVREVTAPTLQQYAQETERADLRNQRPRMLVDWLRQPEHAVIVTNPDIFYYALFGLYWKGERRALLREIFQYAAYVIIDEFHYYNPKQLVCFLLYLGLSRHWGYFAEGRQLALLSATPNDQLKTYLERLGIPISYIKPEDEVGGERIASLAPLELELVQAEGSEGFIGLDGLMERFKENILKELAAGRQGVGISSALWRVNRAYALLREWLGGERVRRLTGPEKAEARQQARGADMILATPTIDIGYNFERLKKERQNIDFLLCDAHSGDQLIQRLGRAGRVLGKRETGVASRAWAAVPEQTLEELKAFEGQEMSREQFRAVIRETMPQQFSEGSYAYIKERGIYELGRPFALLAQMASREETAHLEEILGEIQEALEGRRSEKLFHTICGHFHRYEERMRIFAGFPRDWRSSRECSAGEVQKLKSAMELYKHSQAREEGIAFDRWVEEEQAKLAIEQAQFSFRESFQPPVVLAFDPQELLSSNRFVRYDLLHVLANYEAAWYAEYEEWRRGLPKGEEAPPVQEEDEAFVVLRAQRQGAERMRVIFRLGVDEERREWEERQCGKITALRGLKLTIPEIQLPPELTRLFQERYHPCYCARRGSILAGKLFQVAREDGWSVQELEVTFSDGQAERYAVLFGTAIFLAQPQLERTRRWEQRLDRWKSESTII